MLMGNFWKPGADISPEAGRVGKNARRPRTDTGDTETQEGGRVPADSPWRPFSRWFRWEAAEAVA